MILIVLDLFLDWVPRVQSDDMFRKCKVKDREGRSRLLFDALQMKSTDTCPGHEAPWVVVAAELAAGRAPRRPEHLPSAFS